jgi:predicted esterase
MGFVPHEATYDGNLQMMKSWVLNGVMLLSVFLFLYCGSAEVLDEPASFAKVELELSYLLEEEAYEEALRLLAAAENRFHDNDYELMAHRAEIFARMGKYESSLDVWEAGQGKGYFFGIQRHGELYKPFEKYDRFQQIADEDRRLSEIADETSKSKVEVVLPDQPLVGKKLPLFIALHGDGSSSERAKRFWKSAKLEGEFVVAFIQSYLHSGMKSYSWLRYDPRARQEIRERFRDVVNQYPIDKERIIIGGISAGGLMAIDAAINHVIPAAGFIGVCPGKPEEFDNPRVRTAREDGIKGVILSGENDYNLPYQREMVHVFKKERLPHEFIVLPDMGHEFPEDFSSHIDKAIEFILRIKDGLYPHKYTSRF